MLATVSRYQSSYPNSHLSNLGIIPPTSVGALREESKETSGFVAHDFAEQSLVCYTFAGDKLNLHLIIPNNLMQKVLI